MEKLNFPENSLFYINQSYLAIKRNKKIYYADYFLLGQIIEASNLPQDIQNYELQDREVKYLLPKYNPEIGDFQGLCETIGFIVVRGDTEEIFLNHGYEQLKSKVLHSTYRQKIPNSFCGTMFNCHKTLIECGDVDQGFSHLYFFLPSITDKSESVNQYLKNISISPLDIKQEQLNAWANNIAFKPNKLDFHDVNSKIMTEAVVKSLRHIVAVSNSNLVRNADGLICRKDIDDGIEWVGGLTRTTPKKSKVSY